MANIEKIKRDGMCVALRQAIYSEQQKLNVVFDDTVRQSRYYRLGIAITEAENILANLRKLLVALNELDPPHK